MSRTIFLIAFALAPSIAAAQPLDIDKMMTANGLVDIIANAKGCGYSVHEENLAEYCGW